MYILHDFKNVIKVAGRFDEHTVVNTDVNDFDYVNSSLAFHESKYYIVDFSGSLVIFDVDLEKVTVEKHEFDN